jgi:hypothetical protein
MYISDAVLDYRGLARSLAGMARGRFIKGWADFMEQTMRAKTQAPFFLGERGEV